jgi:hypothetical protein
MSDPGVPHQQVDHSVPQHSPVAYNYILDNGERTITYSPAGDGSMMAYPTPTTAESVNGFVSQHPGPQSSPAFAPYPTTPQSFISTSAHDDPNMHMMAQKAPVESQQMMYCIPGQMKDE